jgi:cephalosporin hydroxylase
MVESSSGHRLLKRAMRLTIDTEAKKLIKEQGGLFEEIDLYSKDAFQLISREWLVVGWNQKYPYTFSWMGRPIIQLPEDIIRVQEIIYQVKPDVIIETGVAHGGSLVFYASLCRAMETGRVIGIDIGIRPHNRKAIEAHEMFPLITLIEGSSISSETVSRVRSLVNSTDTAMVILDSCHSKEHVLSELEAYYSLVTPGSYIVATDGIMKELSAAPRGKREWAWDHPAAAAAEFAERHPEFILEQPAWPFNESELSESVTHWPGAWLKRIS